jgi:transposase
MFSSRKRSRPPDRRPKCRLEASQTDPLPVKPFLRQLLVNARKPIVLIVDGHPTHRAKSVAKFVAEQAGMLELFFLPPYSPELNPDEYVWNDLKSQCTGRKVINSLTQLRQMIV